ncbi:hypothetical protein BHE74_00019706 [Ensete ventricosum]|nr:hypothetical protein BHE74_00019706 [Ensete ventricosum]
MVINFTQSRGLTSLIRTISKIQYIIYSQYFGPWKIVQVRFYEKNVMIINFAQSQGSISVSRTISKI